MIEGFDRTCSSPSCIVRYSASRSRGTSSRPSRCSRSVALLVDRTGPGLDSAGGLSTCEDPVSRYTPPSVRQTPTRGRGHPEPKPAHRQASDDPKEPPTPWVYPSDASRTPARASAARTSRIDLPEARGMPALPRAEAAAPRLPELRLLPGPPRDRAQARRQPTTPRADAVTEPRPARPSADGAGRPRRRRRHGRRPRPAEVVPGALDHARAHPEDQRHPRRRRRPSSAARRRRCPPNVADRPRQPGRRHGRAPGAGPAREEGRLDPRRHRPRPARRGRRRRDGRPHRRRDGRRRSSGSGGCRASTGPALAVQMVTDAGPARPPRHRRQPRLDRRRTSPSTRGWARSSPSGCWASPTRASRCCRSARRRARATPGSSARPSCSTRPTCTSSATSRARTSTQHHGRRRRLRRGPRQRRHQVLRGPVDLHLRPVAGRVPAARFAAGSPTCSCARDRPDPRRLRLREGRRLAAARREGHGRSSPTAGPSGGWSASPARSRRPWRGPGPGADRRGAAPSDRRRGSAGATAASRRRRSDADDRRQRGGVT